MCILNDCGKHAQILLLVKKDDLDDHFNIVFTATRPSNFSLPGTVFWAAVDQTQQPEWATTIHCSAGTVYS